MGVSDTNCSLMVCAMCITYSLSITLIFNMIIDLC